MSFKTIANHATHPGAIASYQELDCTLVKLPGTGIWICFIWEVGASRAALRNIHDCIRACSCWLHAAVHICGAGLHPEGWRLGPPFWAVSIRRRSVEVHHLVLGLDSTRRGRVDL